MGKMAARRITALCKRNVIYIHQVRVKHLKLRLGWQQNEKLPPFVSRNLKTKKKFSKSKSAPVAKVHIQML